MKFKCYLCGNNSAKVIADKKTIRFGTVETVLRCLKCNLVQLYPPVEPSYKRYSAKKDFPGQKIKPRISKYLPKLLGNKNKAKMEILEVGCGRGDNLRYLYDKGYHTVYGIDKDPACKKCAIHYTDWKHHNPQVKLDAIYAIHFFEHVADPEKFLEWVKRTLKPGGRFVFEVPSIDDPLIRLYKNKAYNKFCWYPYHMFFYSRKTLSAILATMNAKIIRRQEYGIINHLRWIFKGKPGNWNPHIPILDDIYKWVLCRFGYSDSLIVVGNV